VGDALNCPPEIEKAFNTSFEAEKYNVLLK